MLPRHKASSLPPLKRETESYLKRTFDLL
jgi:hypothetical protein